MRNIISRILPFFVLLSLFALPLKTTACPVDSLILQNEIIVSSQVEDISTKLSIMVGSPYEVQAGAAVTLTSESVSLLSGFNAQEGSTIHINSIAWSDVNQAPVALADSVTVDEGGTVDFDVTGNDTDPDGFHDIIGPDCDLSIISDLTEVQSGILVLNPDRTFAYTHNGSDTPSTDSFSYILSDYGKPSVAATVTININPVYDPPVAQNDTFPISEDSPETLFVLSNDDVEPGDTITIFSHSTPDQGGFITITNNDTTLDYTPAPNFVGTETFTYIATDSSGTNSAPATVTVNVTNVPDLPVAVPDSYGFSEESYNNLLDVLGNDSDADPGDTFTVIDVSPPEQGGTAWIGPEGKSVYYTPEGNYIGLETFNYTIEDSSMGLQSTTQVTISLVNINDAPLAVSDTYTVSEESSGNMFFVMSNDIDPDPSDTLSITAISGASQGGMINISSAGDSIIYTPAHDFTGTDDFDYTVTDLSGISATANVTVTVSPANDSPQANDDTFTVDDDSINNSLDVLFNDGDVDHGDTLTITSVTSPDNGGTVTINGTATGLVYTPVANFIGTEIFFYTIKDSAALPSSAQVTITVVDNNFPPTANNDELAINEDVAGTVNVLANDTDPDNDLLSIASVSQPVRGTAVDNGDGTITYTPNQNFYGFDSFDYTISDGNGETDSTKVSITVVPLSDDVPDDLLLANITVHNGEHPKYYAKNSITAGPAFKVESGGSATMSSTIISLQPGFSIEEGGSLTIATWATDTTQPTMFSNWPVNGSLIASQGGSVSYLGTFDDVSGIKKITLFDQDGNDITDQAIIVGNTIEIIIPDPVDGVYDFTIFIEDNYENTLEYDISFTVDATIPVTTPSLSGGLYENSVNVSLDCSEDATIYYSTDGYPPFVGAANTIAVNSPTENILLTKNTLLQFFAIDVAGNIETIKSAVYYIDNIPGESTLLEAVYNDTNSQVDLDWTTVPYTINEYRLYRCNNASDCEILDASRTGGYAPPARLRIAVISSTAISYQDSDLVPSATYSYGITIFDERNVEGIISGLIPVTIPAVTAPLNEAESVARSAVWLENNQKPQGYWGDNIGIQVVATSQALKAIQLTGQENAGIHKGLFWLRGKNADNNDYLSRKILTLADFGQNVDESVNKLISQSNIQAASIIGWGIEKRYQIDALDTALGSLAIEKTGRSTLPIGSYQSLRDDLTMRSAAPNKFGWINGKDPSVYVSALAYKILDDNFTTEAPVLDRAWIIANQNPDGSYGSGVIDTAAVLIWLAPDQTARGNAENYLINQQSINGSWQDDPYITGLCLEALLSN